MTYFQNIALKTCAAISTAAIIATLTACQPATTSPETKTSSQTTTQNEAIKVPEFETIATYPKGSLLENLEVTPDGRVLFTSYFAKTIESVSSEGKKMTFANLSGFPVSLISTEEGYLVTAHGKNFLNGPEAFQSQQILLLDKSGNETHKFAAPNALFFNGMVRLKNGAILVADSLAGTIWKIDVEAEKVVPWIQSELLATVPDQNPFFPAANGLKLRSDGLIISNTSKGSILRVKLDKNDNPVGEPEAIAQVGMIDDFWVRDDDSIIFTTHEENLRLLSADGKVSDIISHGCNGCTAIAAYPDGQDKTYVLVNDGNLYLGEAGPSTVLRVTID